MSLAGNWLLILKLKKRSLITIKKIKITKKKNMAAAFLPSILVPIVGLVFPALSMALFFLYISVDDVE
jgi:photosystem I subunit 8